MISKAHGCNNNDFRKWKVSDISHSHSMDNMSKQTNQINQTKEDMVAPKKQIKMARTTEQVQ